MTNPAAEFRNRAQNQWPGASVAARGRNFIRQQIAIKQAVNGTVTDDVINYPAAYGTGIDFEYENQTARLRKLWLIW